MATVKGPTLTSSLRRWFRRTNVYIAEYILMLILMGAFLGLSAALWYSFFGMLVADSGDVSLLAYTAAGQLAGLVIVAPAMYWLYARVTGQEMVQPDVQKSKARTVFLTLWMLGAVLTLVSIAVSLVSAVVMAMYGLVSVDAGTLWVGTIVPALLALATIKLGIFMVVKRETRAFTMLSGWIVLALTVVLLVANAVTLAVKKDDASTEKDTDCTYSTYRDGDCSYSDYVDAINRDARSNDLNSYRDYFQTDL